MEECVQIATTTGSREEARRIAAALVGERLAACVQIAAVESHYRWQGAVEKADELALTIKTTVSRVEGLKDRVRALHSYEVPEIIVMPIVDGSAEYLRWIAESVSPGT